MSLLKVEFPRELNPHRQTYIERVFKYPSDPNIRSKAIKEYEDLIRIEMKCEQLYPNECKMIASTNGRLKIQSYVDLGNDLRKENPGSHLIYMIAEQYKRFALEDQRHAMIEFKSLVEVAQLFNKNKKNIDTGKNHPSSDIPKDEPDVNNEANSYTSHPPSGQPYKHDQQSHQSMSSSAPLSINGHVYYPEQMYKQLESRAQQHWEELTQLRDDVKVKSEEIDELRNRLSGFASKKLTVECPCLSDLSDKNRPTKIAERFHTLYDKEYASALETLTHEKNGKATQTQEDAIKFLTEIIKTGYNFCSQYADKQKRTVEELWLSCLENPFKSAYNMDSSRSSNRSIPKVVTDTFRDMRKSRPDECIKSAVEAFKENVLSNFDLYKRKKEEEPALDAFVDRCIYIIWLMRIQDPPMFIKWPEYGDKIDTETYKEYSRKGSTVKLSVWPAVFLHENGPLMNKGYAMPK